jgi:phospholipase A2
MSDLEEAQADSAKESTKRVEQAKENDKAAQEKDPMSNDPDLGYCNVWVGTTAERTSSSEPPPSKVVQEDLELMQPDAGITVIYFPFLANSKVDGVDPKFSDFMSTWNFVYTPEQIDKVVSLARANFDEGKEQTRRTIRAVYERKKKLRLEKEAEEKQRKRAMKLRLGGRTLGEGSHGDHFS